jgi:hydrogenase nickel incorporation protein HypA/HybF
MLMHETIVAQSMFEVIFTEAEKLNARPICAKITCGTLNAVNDDSLCFAFEAIVKGTICDGMKLQIEHKPMQGRCRNCSEVFDVDILNLRCQKCGGDDFELLPDEPLTLQTIEFETE